MLAIYEMASTLSAISSRSRSGGRATGIPARCFVARSSARTDIRSIRRAGVFDNRSRFSLGPRRLPCTGTLHSAGCAVHLVVTCEAHYPVVEAGNRLFTDDPHPDGKRVTLR
jgi:hypothetical protein